MEHVTGGFVMVGLLVGEEPIHRIHEWIVEWVIKWIMAGKEGSK